MNDTAPLKHLFPGWFAIPMGWAGLALVIFGVLVMYGRIPFPREVAYVLIIVGLIDALIMPTILFWASTTGTALTPAPSIASAASKTDAPWSTQITFSVMISPARIAGALSCL